jgi:hypothetical protein
LLQDLIVSAEEGSIENLAVTKINRGLQRFGGYDDTLVLRGECTELEIRSGCLTRGQDDLLHNWRESRRFCNETVATPIDISELKLASIVGLCLCDGPIGALQVNVCTRDRPPLRIGNSPGDLRELPK